MHLTLINVAAMKRKDFLTRVGLAGAGFSIVPRHVLGGKGFTAPSDTLYIGAIGAGGRGGANAVRSGQAPARPLGFARVGTHLHALGLRTQAFGSAHGP